MKAIKLLCIFFIFSFSISAEQQKIYKIGVENIDYYPHYAFGHRKNSFTKELLETFFNKNKIKYEFVPLPLKRFHQWYLKDHIDLKYPDNAIWRQDESIKQSIKYSIAVVSSLAGGITQDKHSDYTVKDIQRLGTISGFSSTLWLKKIKNKQLLLIEDTTVLSVIKMVLHNIVDVTNLDYSVINFHLNQLKQNKKLIMNKNLPYQKIVFHLSTIKHPEIISKFNVFLQQNADFVQKLKVKYRIIENPLDLTSF
ncbi:hypothetical protein [Pseudoalteromonas denitrificans]|uniref:Solute-binding protein family 3/N-terminal domain-containing protein n=1 Tax=Pseudoalteromonas denitrificans DSM 6059 TaxID=1123010 RepID=A0A1I1P4P2_9GAMM|nr:hypothetical protein [Pseudoalteromonas denitrificans]SFD04777.1 hypothetical protein SAMN02745724_03306 [Pseudoalteromonas denitrificans DSM 6059]